MLSRSLAVVFLLGLMADAARAQEVEAELYRTRAEPDLTVVAGVLSFDLALLQGAAECAYDVAVRVRDSAGTSILDDRWTGQARCEGAGASRDVDVVETFRFAVAPGRYSVELSVEPQGRPEARREINVALASLAEDAVASDLILGREIGHVGGEGSVWTVEVGAVGVAAAPTAVIDRSNPKIAYYVEVYGAETAAQEGQAVAVIRRAAGDELARVSLGEWTELEARKPLAGSLPLAGLPPGDYELEVRVEMQGKTLARSQPFQMAERKTPSVAGAARRAPARQVEIPDYFERLSAYELETTFAPIVLWLETDAQRRAYGAMSAEAKRQFLAGFFEGVEPTPDDGQQSKLDEFLARVERVRREFAEVAGRGEQDGWRTDRGRLYIRHGQPDDLIEQRYPRDDTTPYLIWFYDIGPGYVYFFVDDTNFQHYRLVFSNDPNEPRVPGWQRYVGQAAREDLARYYKIALEPRFAF